MNKNINILDLLALVEVFNEYDEFDKDLTKLLSSKRKSIDTLYKIRAYSDGEKGLYPKSIKMFCEKHKETIQKINKYENIQSFLYHSYDYEKGTKIYQYLSTHRDELNQIKSVLLRLKDLGVSKIEFDEEFDFSEKTYYMYTWLADNVSIHYVDNMEIMPEYPHGKISYQTTSSPFEIKFSTSFGEICKLYNSAKVNSLTFDPNRLPSSATKSDVIDYILMKQAEKKEEYEAIRYIIDLRQVERLLESKLRRLEAILNNVDKLSDKESVVNALKTIKSQLENIKTETEQYEADVTFESTYITPELLDKEEEAYERRKRDSECHIW